MARTTVFVYGTLKCGQRNHRFLHGQEFLGEGCTTPHYRLYFCHACPCLVEDRRAGLPVRGEIWRVDDEALGRLDELEEVPVLYRRERIKLDGLAEPVWAYLYNGEVAGAPDCGASWPPTQ